MDLNLSGNYAVISGGAKGIGSSIVKCFVNEGVNVAIIDIDDVFGHKTNAEMFHYIKDNLSFDNLIWEFGGNDNPAWVHVSFVSDDQNRKQVLKAYKEQGTTIYKLF